MTTIPLGTPPGTPPGKPLGRRALAGAAALPFLAATGLALTGKANAQTTAESTFDRVRRTKVLRIAALPGEPVRSTDCDQ